MKSIFFYTYIPMLYLMILQNEVAIGNVFQVAKDTDDLWKAVGYFIGNCFSKYFGNSIMIGDWSSEENIVLNSVFANSIPISLMASNEREIYQKHQYFRGFFRMNQSVVSTKYKLANNVTIIVTSNVTLIKILQDLRTSIWWNSEAYFILVNADIKNGCRLAKEFLKIVWEFKILSALYFCKNIENRVKIYNFNPFTRLGSDFWKVDRVYNKENERWTLLEYSFNGFPSLYETHAMRCDNFDFDKTRNLNEYHIRMGTYRYNEEELSKNPRLGFADYGGQDYKILDLVLEKMNAHATLKYYSSFGLLTNKGPVGFLKDIELGELDFLLFKMFMRDYWKLQTYPFDTNGICIVTRTHPVPFAKRFMSIFTLQVWILLSGTGFISIITLKFTLKQCIIQSSMDFLRMFITTPTVKTPINSHGKFLFLSILFLIFQINLYIQSQLSAMQTIPDYTPTVDSTDDLINSNLSIYGEKHHKEFVYHTELRERFQVIPDIYICLKSLVNDEEFACLAHCDILKTHNYLNHEIYKARNNLFNRPIAYTISDDWPLQSKVNLLLSYINEVGIYDCYSDEFVQSEQNANQYETVNIKQLTFCFFIFFGGCIFSVFTFFLEITIHKLKQLYQMFLYSK